MTRKLRRIEPELIDSGTGVAMINRDGAPSEPQVVGFKRYRVGQRIRTEFIVPSDTPFRAGDVLMLDRHLWGGEEPDFDLTVVTFEAGKSFPKTEADFDTLSTYDTEPQA